MSLEQLDDEKLPLKTEHLLHIHLNEYRKLKDEQVTRIVMREHMIYVTLGILGGVSSYALHAGQQYAFLVIPWVCIILGWLYITTDEKVSAIGAYLRHDLSQKLETLTQATEGTTLGWETTHRSDKYRVSRKITQILVDLLTFVISGLCALLAFWWLQPEMDKIFQVILGIEGVLLIWLGIIITVSTDVKKGR